MANCNRAITRLYSTLTNLHHEPKISENATIKHSAATSGSLHSAQCATANQKSSVPSALQEICTLSISVPQWTTARSLCWTE